jgi:hypothetical protein
MKKNMNYALLILLLLFAWSTSQAQDQVINFLTGDAGAGLLPPNTPEPNWTTCPPGYDHTQPGFFGPVQVADATPRTWYGPPITSPPLQYYTGHDASTGFITPVVAPYFVHYPAGNAVNGDWYYKRKFNVYGCQMEYAELIVEHAGADNYISEIFINGHPHAFPYTTGTLFDVHNGVTIFIPGSELNPGVQNELEVHVVNQGTSADPTGLEFKATLNLYAYAATDASFNISFAQYNNNLYLSSPYNFGTHKWEVFSSNSGIPGSYNSIGTFQGPDITLSSAISTAPCYYVKHTFETYCGTACEAYSACKLGCDYIAHDPKFCDLPAPQNLRYNALTKMLSWDPVPGAYKYTVFVYPNDPECCDQSLTMSKSRNYTTDVLIPEFQLTGDVNCFSFKVRAICEDGSEGPYSEKFCNNDHVWGFGAPAQKTGIEVLQPLGERAVVNMYPNPAKSTVSFDIDMPTDVSFSMTMIDINGKTVKSVGGLKTSGKKASMTLSTEGLSKGAYIVKIAIPNGEGISKKLMIE